VLQDGRKSAPLGGVSAYLEVAAGLRVRAAAATSAEGRREFERLAALYEKLAPICAAPPRSAAWQGIPFNYDRKTISTIVPSAAGVYLLWRPDRWIYIGECVDLQRRLTAHMQGDDERINREAPRGFGFELMASAPHRVARREALIRELTPVCILLAE